MLGQAFGERASALDHLGQFSQDALQRRVLFLLLKHFEPGEKRQAGGSQLGQLAGEDRENLFLNLTRHAGDTELHLPDTLFGALFAFPLLGLLGGGLGLLHLHGRQAHLL